LNSERNPTLCVTGFFGSTKDDKKITTIGRGGTDLTSAVLAYAMRNSFQCNVIYWKDVKGLLDADPKIVKEGNVIKAITSIYEISMVTVEGDTMVPLPGAASKLFSLLGNNNIDLIFISQSSSENNLTFGIQFEDSKKVSFLLRNSDLFGKSWFRIKIDNDISLVAVIGAGVLHTPGIAGKVFTTLGDNKINILAIAQGSSELNFTAIIERKDCKKAINVLYDAFINTK